MTFWSQRLTFQFSGYSHSIPTRSIAVKKKLKQKSFAASVNRDDIFQSIEELGVDLTEHIQFVIDALVEKAHELGLAG